MRIGIVNDGLTKIPVIMKDNQMYRAKANLTNESYFNTVNDEKMVKIEDGVEWEIPIPFIPSLRDFYSFEGHVRNARKKRGLAMEEEWYRIPAYYYSGTSMLYANGQSVTYPEFTMELDYEIEVAIVIGKSGKNIKKEDALQHVFGFTIANDWSARDLQRREMKIGLGPSKSKDFGTSLGTYITTIDELEYRIENDGHLNIDMKAYVNGKEYFTGNTRDMYWGINDLVSWASTESNLRVGDVLMTGTLSNGSILEKENNESLWLKSGDEVKIESPQLGFLSNKVM